MFVLLVGYAGLFRISELLNLKVKDISIGCAGMTIFVSQRKNDQFREGHTSVIARSSKVSCPVALIEKVLALLKAEILRNLVFLLFDELFAIGMAPIITSLWG